MIFYLAGTLFLANFALGVLVQFGIVDTKPFRWLHHALFFAVFASAALAAGAGGHAGSRGARLPRHDPLRYRVRILALGGLCKWNFWKP